MGGIESWYFSVGVSRVGGTFLTELRVGGLFLAEAVKPTYGGIFSVVMQHGGNFLAVGGF